VILSAVVDDTPKQDMANYRERYWEQRWKVAHRVRSLPIVGRPFAFFSDQAFASRFVRDLRRINDVLASTDLAGRYWIWSGLLLGWAREGRLLSHDRDADFAVLAEDLPRLLGAVPALRKAGFRPLLKFRNNDGKVTELTFRRGYAKYDFFLLEPVEGAFHYFVYGWPPDNLVQLVKQVPAQELVSFDFLGRTWLRTADSESELEAMYGDWRTPRHAWNYLHDGANVVSRVPWVDSQTSWSG
jgi:hypothetical protein